MFFKLVLLFRIKEKLSIKKIFEGDFDVFCYFKIFLSNNTWLFFMIYVFCNKFTYKTKEILG